MSITTLATLLGRSLILLVGLAMLFLIGGAPDVLIMFATVGTLAIGMGTRALMIGRRIAVAVGS